MATFPKPSEALRQAKDYREFLRAYLEWRSLSLSDFARATGFGRGFPGDVISGKRRLTLRSFRAFEKAIKLAPDGKRFFRYLVAQTERDLFPEWDADRIAQALQTLRKKPWTQRRRNLHANEVPNVSSGFGEKGALLVYAACGSPEEGASLGQVLQRTQLPSLMVDRLLQNLQRIGLLEKRDDRFLPTDLHLFLKTEGEAAALISLIQDACKSAAERVPHALASPSELFFTSGLCVAEAKLPELKAALRATILQFIDEAIDPQGDRVIRLSALMHF